MNSTSGPTDLDSAARLLERAERLRDLLRGQARRAFVLEFTGTPKAGKSTSVEVLKAFFKQAGYHVHLLKERAADCPLPMKGHFFFNAWTTATMLAEVLETYETNVDLLILDRGFFDALIWLELQDRRAQVTRQEKEVFANFVLLDRWRSLVDCTVVMKVEPLKALERERSTQIVERTGSMMNERSLAEFNEALADASQQYGSRFSLIEIDTTQASGSIKTCTDLLSDLLPMMESWADPQIAVVPIDDVKQIFADRHFIHENDVEDALNQVATNISLRRRSDAENDPSLVQFVAAGVLVHDERFLILERERRDRKADYGRTKLWIGCHVETDVSASAAKLICTAKDCLGRRIQQELHLATPITPALVGLAWERDRPQHLGMMFKLPVPNQYVADHLEEKHFKKMGRSGRLTSRFQTRVKIITTLAQQKDLLDLEPWSEYFINNVGPVHPEPSKESSES
ncbi:MAG: hypothetical protein H6729_06740 [Deltaproteobacteria bacterium]|nr:hypothetical protein [Deltaproteobacteria bacterium]